MEETRSGLKGVLFLLAWITLACTVQFFASTEMDPYIYSIFVYCGINMILASSLNLISGYTGQFSIGHAGFMSVGAYSSAYASMQLVERFPESLDPTNPLASLFFLGVLAIGGLTASIAGLVVGLPSLRLKGDYLAIVTLGFGEMIRVLFLNIDAVGGARGLPSIPAWSNLGWVYSFLGLTVFLLWRLIHSTHGRQFMAVREDEIAAESMGLSTTKVKVRAFVLGAFFAGLAGALFAHFLRYINPQTFDFNRSFELIIMVVLGGMGNLIGSLVSATLLTFLREGLRPLQEITKIDLRMIFYALLLIIMMLTRPQGLFGKSMKFGRKKGVKKS